MAGKITGTPGGARRGRKSANLRVVTDGGAVVDDNMKSMTAEEREAAIRKQREEREEAEAMQLLSVVSQIKRQDTKVEAARADLKTETDALNDIFTAAKLLPAKFQRKELRALVEDSSAGKRKDVTEAEARRARHRRAMGLPVGLTGEEQDLQARLPDVERDGTFWEAAGYTDGISGAPFAPPVECVKAGHDNRYREGHDTGMNKLAASFSKKPAKPKANPLDDPASPESLKAAAEARAAEPGSPEAQAAERRSIAAAKKSLDGMGADTATEPTGGAAVVEGASAGDGFAEMTDEERAAQIARPSVAEAEGEATGEAV